MQQGVAAGFQSRVMAGSIPVAAFVISVPTRSLTMKKLIAIIVLLALAVPCEAGPILRLLGRGKTASGKVLHRATHPFSRCAGGSCGR